MAIETKSLRVRQSPAEGNPPAALVSPPTRINQNQGFETRAGGFCLCSRDFSRRVQDVSVPTLYLPLP
ncbi:hypothetical protein LC593_08330 [Nostoc sp. CHAB 5844]|nr:hypothetical protein [Nostoc sp. CHAB 5844]